MRQRPHGKEASHGIQPGAPEDVAGGGLEGGVRGCGVESEKGRKTWWRESGGWTGEGEEGGSQAAEVAWGGGQTVGGTGSGVPAGPLAFLVADGESDVVGDCTLIRTIDRAKGFGEIALLRDSRAVDGRAWPSRPGWLTSRAVVPRPATKGTADRRDRALARPSPPVTVG
jgi:hypothetical protein